MPPAAFEDVKRARQVAVGVRVRVLDRVAHARLRREVDDPLDVALCKEVFHARAVGQVEFLEAESVLFAKPCEPGLLQRRIVVGIQVVEADDLVAAREQESGDVVADEACRTRDQHFHQSRPSDCPRSSRYLMS